MSTKTDAVRAVIDHRAAKGSSPYAVKETLRKVILAHLESVRLSAGPTISRPGAAYEASIAVFDSDWLCDIYAHAYSIGARDALESVADETPPLADWLRMRAKEYMQ